MKLDSNVAVFGNKLNRVFEAEYDAWGKQTVIKNEIGFNHGYTGHEMLFRSDLIHMDGRLYDPTIGRFLSPDRSAEGRLPKQELRAAAGELAEFQPLPPSLLIFSNEGDYNCSDAQYFRSTSVNGSYLNKEKTAASLS